MSTKFKTVITTAGAAKLAAATVPGGKKVNLSAMAVGDGNGKLPVPDAGQTKLVHEVWRHALNKVSVDNKNKNYIVAELVVPPEVGGFWMRELGLYDDAGTLIAVSNMAESYKPELAEGSGRAQTCRMVIILSNVASVELSIDASTVMATQDYVDDKIAEHEQSRRHPDATLTEKGFTQLSSATNSTSEKLAATPKAVKAANDNANSRLAKNQNGADIQDKSAFLDNIGVTSLTFMKHNGMIPMAQKKNILERGHVRHNPLQNQSLVTLKIKAMGFWKYSMLVAFTAHNATPPEPVIFTFGCLMQNGTQPVQHGVHGELLQAGLDH